MVNGRVCEGNEAICSADSTIWRNCEHENVKLFDL